MEGAEKYYLVVILEYWREVSARALLDEPIHKIFPHSMLLADNRSDQHAKIVPAQKTRVKTKADFFAFLTSAPASTVRLRLMVVVGLWRFEAKSQLDQRSIKYWRCREITRSGCWVWRRESKRLRWSGWRRWRSWRRSRRWWTAGQFHAKRTRFEVTISKSSFLGLNMLVRPHEVH